MDDSGSMYNIDPDRWYSANYALQTMLGIFDPADSATLYYIGDEKPRGQKIDLSDRSIQSTLNKLANKNANQNTYLYAVQMAYDDMNKAYTPGAADEYWLVVITDGIFDRDTSRSADAVRNTLTQYAKAGLGSEGYPLNILYCTIGDGASRIDTDGSTAASLEAQRIYCFHAQKTGDIIHVMNNLADKLSGRARLTGNALSLVDSRTLQVSSDIPLFNFIVMYQGQSIQPESASTGGLNLTVTRRLQVIDPSGWKLKSSMFTVNNEGKNIPAGTYTISFRDTDQIDLSKVTVLFEPALEVRITHYLPSGQEISLKDLRDNAYEGGDYAASCQIYEAGTDKIVRLSQLPTGTTLSLSVQAGGKASLNDSGAAPAVSGVTLTTEQVTVTGALTLPGYPQITAVDTFTPKRLPVYEGKLKGQKDLTGQTLEVTVEQLKRSEKYLDFEINEDGSILRSDSALKALGLVFDTDLEYDIEYPGNGTVRFRPKYSSQQNLLGDHPVDLVINQGGKKVTLGIAVVRVKPSVFTVEVSPKTMKLKEAEFREKERQFTFKLKVDGKASSAEDYGLTFDTKLANSVEWKNGNAVVTVRYTPGMQPDDYPIAAVYEGSILNDNAVLSLLESAYVITAKPESASVKQTEFESNPQLFQITLTEDKKFIDPATLAVEKGSFPGKVTFNAHAKDKNTWELILGGDIAVPEGDYTVTLVYTTGSGRQERKEITLSVVGAVYQITHTPDRQMIFNSLQELESNAETFSFAVLADGRALTPEEMDKLIAGKVVGIEKDPQDTPAMISTIDSGFSVQPGGKTGLPSNSTQNAAYAITCMAGAEQDTVVFQYQHMIYEVDCITNFTPEIVSTDLFDNTACLCFVVKGNGQQLPRDNVEGNFEVSVASEYSSYVRLDTMVDADGTIAVTPKMHTKNWLLSRFIPLLLRKGDMTVTLTFKNTGDTGLFTIASGGLIPEWLPYIILTLIVLYLIIMILKKRFSHRAHLYYMNCTVSGARINNLSGQWWDNKRLFPPLSAIWPFSFHEKKKVNGAVVRAAYMGRKATRAAGIQVRIPRSNNIWPISGNEIDLDNPEVHFDNPQAYQEPQESGWYDLGDGDAFVLIDDNEAVVFKYQGT